jgi:hypothetical protein
MLAGGAVSSTFRELGRAKPCRQDGRRAEHAADAQRLLRRLREAGASGVTTAELIAEKSFGLRPPNRIGDLRRAGHLIETRRERHGVFRFVLIRESENPIEQRPAKKKPRQTRFSDSADWYERATGKPRPSGEASGLPLFSGVR